MSGIKGLQGVVRKTVNDELQANIWDPQHMDKIVPSLLFNLQHAEEAERWVGLGFPSPSTTIVTQAPGASLGQLRGQESWLCDLFCNEYKAGSSLHLGLASVGL